MKKAITLLTILILSTSLMAHSTTSIADKKFITGMAEEIGEYFRYDDPFNEVDYKNYIYLVNLENLKKSIRDKMQIKAVERKELLKDFDESEFCDAVLDSEQFMIIKDGKIIGYVIHVYDSIDHPLWDGSGVRFYIDVQGNVLTTIEWVG